MWTIIFNIKTNLCYCHTDLLKTRYFSVTSYRHTCLFVFQDETGKPVRVIVKGEPASGKTTFVKKVCSEWSTLHKRCEEPVCSEIKDVLGEYDLLIPIILRLVKHGASLEDTIKDQIELDEKKMLILKWMLKKTERTVLVFDGLDEYNINRSSDITSVMKGNTFKHVIITSRAEAANKTQEWKQIIYKEAELKGFSDEHIKLYVEKFFKTSKEQEISLITHIFKKDSNLLELARNPGSLCMICILHNDGTEIHHMTREQLYEEYVAFLLSRWEQRQNPEGEKTPRSEILKKYHETLLKFGELANSDIDSDGADDKDNKELSFTMDQIKSIIGEDAFNYGYLYKSHPSSRLISSRYSFIHKTLHEFFLAYFIKHNNLDSFTQRLYKNRDSLKQKLFFTGLLVHRNLLKQELSLTRFLLHLFMSPKEACEFTSNIIGSKPDKDLFIVLLELYTGYQHDEHQTTLTFNDWYSYIYQYPCYVIRADREYHHQDSLSSYNKDMIRRMNTDNKHKTVTVPILQTASIQRITSGDDYDDDDDLLVYDYHLNVYCRPDYEVTVTGQAHKLKELCLRGIEKLVDINLDPVSDNLKVDIMDTNLHGHVVLTKPWMALIQSLRMWSCKLEAGDISAMADSIQACTSPTGAESASPCRLQKLNLSYNILTGAGADIARIIPLCTEINLGRCKLEAGDISVIADSIEACTSPTGAESASPCRLQELGLRGNSLTGAGADMARFIPLCTEIGLSECKLEAGDISAMAESIKACTSPTGAESASPSRLQKLDLSHNSLTGAGADIASIIPLCTEIDLGWCKLEAGDISAMAESIKACTSPTGAESASPCRLQKLDLKHNRLTGAGADIARFIPLCTEIGLSECELEAGDISAMAKSIKACTSPTGAESASPCRLQKLDLKHKILTGAGADIARIISCIPLCTEIHLGWCDLNDEDFHAIVNAIIQTHSDRHTSVQDHSTPDRRQTSRIKPASPGPASHIEWLDLQYNKFSDVETVRLLLDNLPTSLRLLWLYDNQFNEEEMEEIRTYKDKHPHLGLFI